MRILFTLVFTLSVLQSFAQAAPDTLQHAIAPAAPAVSGPALTEAYPRNTVKVNLSSLLLNNYSFSYERSFNRKFSFVAGYSFVPKTKVGSMFLAEKAIDKWLEEDDEIVGDLNASTLANESFTGELRYYAGKHPGARGFYVSLYGRYTNMKATFPDRYEINDKTYLLPFDGKVQGIGGGLMIGAQWLLGKNITLDWYILGAHYGKLHMDMPAIANLSTMTADEKLTLKEDIEALNDDFGSSSSLEATVTDTRVDVKGNMPFAGIRGLGFNIGYTF